MSSVSSLTSSTSSLYNSNRITGLASGLDTDSLIESMTTGTRSKIAKQKQELQRLQWQMDAFRSISSQLISFQNKYTSFSSSTNLRSESFFGKNLISALGDNSKYISVSGTSANASNIRITSINKLAQNENVVSKNSVSTQKLQAGEAISDTITTSKLAGTKLSFEFGNSGTQSITLDATKTYDEPKQLVEEINTKLKELKFTTSDGTSKDLSEAMEATLDSNNQLVLQTKGDYAGTNIKIKDGTSQALLDAVGWEVTKDDQASNQIVGTKELTSEVMKEQQTTKNWYDLVTGKDKSITLNYNGKAVEIKLPGSVEEFTKNKNDSNKAKNDFAQYLQQEINNALGENRIRVSYGDQNGLSFETVQQDGQSKDTTSILKITSGNYEALQAMGLKSGASNRVNLNATVAESGLNANSVDLTKVEINGKKLQDIVGKDKDLKTMSVSEIIKAVNASDANVTISYNETADKFSIASTIEGAAGKVELSTEAQKLFSGVNNITAKDPQNPNQVSEDYFAVNEGQDAEIEVDFDGTGGADAVTLTRSSNTIDLDGLTVTLKGTFQSEANNPNSAITFDAKVDSEKVTTAVKDMITAFNDIIKLSNDELSTKPNRDYAPLTDEQKEEMTEEQIEEWEKKAKEGMLFNDSSLRSFTSEIRFIFSGDANTVEKLKEMGITVSSTYSDHGKISFDEEKFKAFLEKDSDTVAELFTASSNKATNDKGGIMTQAYEVFEKYAATTGATKGVFVEKAGATESPLSMLTNSLQKEMNDIDDYIDTLQSKLEDETERYYQKFTSLEVYIQQMNSQSSWLSQQFSY